MQDQALTFLLAETLQLGNGDQLTLLGTARAPRIDLAAKEAHFVEQVALTGGQEDPVIAVTLDGIRVLTVTALQLMQRLYNQIESHVTASSCRDHGRHIRYLRDVTELVEYEVYTDRKCEACLALCFTDQDFVYLLDEHGYQEVAGCFFIGYDNVYRGLFVTEHTDIESVVAEHIGQTLVQVEDGNHTVKH